MTKISRKEAFKTIKAQAGVSGVVQANNNMLALVMGCSRRSMSNILDDLENEKLIKRETSYIKRSGTVIGVRYIIITDPESPKKGFLMSQHKNLGSTRNHYCKTYNNGPGRRMTYEWWRRPDGEGGEWENVFDTKEFEDCGHVWEFAYSNISRSRHIYHTGDYKATRYKILPGPECGCKECQKRVKREREE